MMQSSSSATNQLSEGSSSRKSVSPAQSAMPSSFSPSPVANSKRRLQRKLMAWALAFSIVPVFVLGGATVLTHQTLYRRPSQAQNPSVIEVQLWLWLSTGSIAVFAGAAAAIVTHRFGQRVLSAQDITTDLVNQLNGNALPPSLSQSKQDEMAVLTANLEFLQRQLPRLCSQVEEAVEPLQIFMELAHHLRLATEESEILQLVTKAARRALRTDRVIILCFSAQGESTVVGESAEGRWSPLLWSSLPNPDVFLSVSSSKVHAINDVYDADLPEFHLDFLELYEVKAALIAPIFTEDKKFGYLIAHECSSSRLWQPSELELWGQLALQSGLSLEQSHGPSIESATLKPERRLQDIYQKMRASPGEDQLLNTMVHCVREHLNTARALIIRVEDIADSGIVIAESILPGCDTALKTHLDPAVWSGRGESGEALAPQVIPNLEKNNIFPGQQWSDLGVKACVLVPIFVREQLFGFLGVHQCSGPREWQPTDVDWLVQLAQEGGAALTQQALMHQQQVFEHQVDTFVQSSGSLISELTEIAFEQHGLVDKIYRQVRGLSKVSQTLDPEQGEHTLPFQDLHQTTQLGYQTIDQISEGLMVLYKAVLQISLMIQGFDQPVQQLEEGLTAIDHLAAQLKLQGMNATLAASQAGRAGQNFAVIGEQVYALSRQLTFDVELLQPLANVLRGGVQDLVIQIMESQQHISAGRDLNRILKRGLTQVLSYPVEVDSFANHLSQTVAEQRQRTAVAEQTLVDLAHLTSQMTELSAAISAAHQHLASLTPE